jgi:aspartate/glutamate racemase
MRTLGIVGGIGPESTIEYYRFILDTTMIHVKRAVTELLA